MSEVGLGALSLLVVDDNRHMLKLVKQVLHSLGIRRVILATDGVDAFKEMRHTAIDIVICDLAMEPIDGLDFTRLVRTAPDSPDPFVPIVMLTGHTERGTVKQARDAGITEFLAKPISARNLYSRLVEVIENPRLFIRSKSYTGPCRRRADMAFKGPERRHDRMATESQESVDELFASNG